jgi:hypothetical protein
MTSINVRFSKAGVRPCDIVRTPDAFNLPETDT